jgi:hypothetical protein
MWVDEKGFLWMPAVQLNLGIHSFTESTTFVEIIGATGFDFKKTMEHSAASFLSARCC